MKFVVSVLFAALLVGSLEARTWTQAATGKEIEAEFVESDGESVSLRLANGAVAQVLISSLSEADQRWIASQASAGASASGEWPQFRGPNRDGISTDTGLMSEWPDSGPKQLWVYDDAGNGYSGFAISGGKLYTMGTRGAALEVICLNVSDGSEVWSSRFANDDQVGYNPDWGHGPRGTPTVNDGMVYVTGPKGTVACLKAEDGSKVWSKHLVDDFGGKAGGWGFSASPLVDGDRVVVAPGGEEAGIVCLDKKTGSVIWKASEVQPGKAEYASIVPCEINGTWQYVKLFQTELVGVSAEDGSLLWTSPWEGKTAVIPTPIVQENELYITSGYGVGCKLVSIDADYNATDVWRNREMKNHHGGVIYLDGYIYGFSEGPGLMCQSWETGEMVWNHKDRYTLKGSVHLADGMLYAFNEDDGTLTLVEANPDGYVEKGQLKLEPESEIRHAKGKFWTHPVVIGGVLYLRDQDIIAAYAVR
ncbi:MAG: PQQ-binding-like beta-propeller repeat protein [Verrucomicrobiota bacterium]